jgi:hypothetical protein
MNEHHINWFYPADEARQPRFVYQWSHSMEIKVFRLEQKYEYGKYEAWTLVDVIKAVAPDGDPATFRQAHTIAFCHYLKYYVSLIKTARSDKWRDETQAIN